jgi:two-component system response regulator MprA
MTTILIADDDPKLLNMARLTLIYEGFQVITATTGSEALAQIQTQSPDLLILDWLMPEMNGVEVLIQLRNAGNLLPILMLTARNTVEDRVEGLDRGADDYLVKPFAPTELLARLRALLRRFETTRPDRPLTYAGLHLDPGTREARRGDRVFELTPTEFELLAYLLRHPRQVLPRETILTAVWGYDFEGNDNVLEVYIGYLRKKTEAGGHPRLIQTVHGVGYVLKEE